jgi:hypothetical protein
MLLLLSYMAYSWTLKMEAMYSSKCRALFELHGVITQKTMLSVVTAMVFSNLAYGVNALM